MLVRVHIRLDLGRTLYPNLLSIGTIPKMMKELYSIGLLLARELITDADHLIINIIFFFV